jgi:hypothetical protein
MGELGSWLRSWVTRRDMNTSESMVCFGVRVAAAVVYIPGVGAVATVGFTVPVMASMGTGRSLLFSYFA